MGHPGPEAVGVADALTVALEVLAVGPLVWPSRRGVERWSRWVRAAVLASAWTLVVAGSTLAIADIATHGHVEVAETIRDDIAPRSWPGAHVEGSSTRPEPDRTDTADHGAAHTHAPGEGH